MSIVLFIVGNDGKECLYLTHTLETIAKIAKAQTNYNADNSYICG